MKRVLLAWDNSCDRCKRAVTVTTLRLPALGTHIHTCTVHTQPLAATGEGTDLLLLRGTCLSSAGVKEQPGERAGGAERARLTWGMAAAGGGIPHGTAKNWGRGECAASPAHSDRMELLSPAPARGCGARALGKANCGEVPAVNVVSTVQMRGIVL